jgi:hypothetical protein
MRMAGFLFEARFRGADETLRPPPSVPANLWNAQRKSGLFWCSRQAGSVAPAAEPERRMRDFLCDQLERLEI